MISETMWKKVDETIRAYWHYNDEGKAYTPETWERLMEQYFRIDRTWRKKKHGYESLVKHYRETGQAVPAENGTDPEEPCQDREAEEDLCELLQRERELVQICDPASLKIPLWREGNIPDMNKLEEFHLVCSDATASDSLDGEDYMPGFVPYFLEDGKKHPVILVLAGGHRANWSSGDPVCRYFNGIGCHAVLMGHRVGKQRLNFCLDLQRAIRLLRYRAEEWQIDTARIGAIGLSFGGVVITDYIEQLSYEGSPAEFDPGYQEDEIDGVSGELNAFLGCYTSSDPFLPRSKDLDYSQYPPVFLAMPGADEMVDFQVSYLNDLVQHGVRTEAHLFDGGVHGFGLGDSHFKANGIDGHIPAIALWPKLAGLWLERIFGITLEVERE